MEQKEAEMGVGKWVVELFKAKLKKMLYEKVA